MKRYSVLAGFWRIANYVRAAEALGALAICAGAATVVHAQFHPIPNYVGIGAGAQFRNDVNNHLSGAATVAPRIVSLPFGQLPTEREGQEYWCADCKQTNPCVGSGPGALALGAQGQWSCTSGATLPNGFPLSIDVSASAHRIQGLAPNSSTGDALSQGQSHLNDLTTATANYNMGANRLQNLSAGSAAGDAISYGQSGATLNGLNLNSNTLSGIAPATASGQAIAFAQGNAQLKTNNPTIAVASSSLNGPSATPLSISAPASIVAGRALVLVMGAGSSPGFTLPSGFAQIRLDAGAEWSQVAACKTATGSEPSSYSVSFTGGANNGTGGILQLTNTDCAHLDSNSGGYQNSTLSFTMPSVTAAQTNEYILAAGSNFCVDPPNLNTGQVFVSNGGNGRLAVAGYLQAANGASLTPVASVPATDCSPHTMAGAQIAFIPTSIVQSAPLITNQAGAQLSALNASVNNVLNVMAPPYSALGDGNTDDLGGLQQAIYDACGATPPASFPNATRKTVYLPRTPVCYMHSAPLRVPCGNLEIKGDTGSALCQNYSGNAMIQEGWASANLPYGSALVGSGNSLVSASGQLAKSIDLARFVNGPSGRSLNARFATGFNIAFFMKPTANSSSQQVLGSRNAYPGTPSGSGAFTFGTSGNQVNTAIIVSPGRSFIDGVENSTTTVTSATAAFVSSDAGRQVFGIGIPVNTTIASVTNGTTVVLSTAATATATGVNITLGGIPHTFASCSAQTLNTTYELEMDWDGTTYRVWQGVPGGTAALCDSWASSNRLTQGPFEEIMLPDGGSHQFWPDGSSNQGNAFVGNLDSVRFEAQSVHTAAYTVPNAKFISDSYTELLVNFDTSLDGTQIGYTGYGIGGTANVYLSVLDTQGSIGAVAFDNLHDFELCSHAGGGSIGNNTDGLFVAYGNGSKWTNLACSNAYYSQADFFGNDYLAHVENWNGFGGHVGLNFGAAWNDSINSNAQIDGTDVACEVYQGGGGGDHEDYHSRCVDRGALRYGWIENQSQANYYYPFVDQENINNNFVATFLLDAPQQPYIFVGGNIDTRNAAPYVQQDFGSYGSIFLGTTFNSFGQSVPAPEIINYTNGSPVAPTQLINIWNPGGVPLSNQAGNPNILTLGSGQNSMMQSLELQQVPKFDVGLNHLIVNPIADPAAATISVVGGTGGTAYGPYFVVCHDINGGVTNTSLSSNTVANGPASLSVSNYINIAWSAVTGCATFDILKGSTSAALALGVTGVSYHDIGGATSAYTAPTRNTTGDISGFAQINTGTTFAKLPGAVVNGMRMYCSNCDPPTNPPVTCTSSGAHTGAFVDGVNNTWLCVP